MHEREAISKIGNIAQHILAEKILYKKITIIVAEEYIVIFP